MHLRTFTASKGPPETNRPAQNLFDIHDTPVMQGGSSSIMRSLDDSNRIHVIRLDTRAPHGPIAGLELDKVRFLISGRTVMPLNRFNFNSPRVQKTNGLELQLVRLVTGLPSAPSTYPPSTNSLPYTQAAFRLLRNGSNVPTRSFGLQFYNRQGAAIVSPVYAGTTDASEQTIVQVGINLEEKDGPFQLRASFIPALLGYTNATVTLQDIPFSDNGTWTALNREVDLGYTKILILGTGGTDAKSSEEDGFVPNQPYILIQNVGDPTMEVSFAGMNDKSGKLIAFGGGQWGQNRRLYFYVRGAAPQSVDLKLNINKSLEMRIEAMPVKYEP